jgi:hypothetical protein
MPSCGFCGTLFLGGVDRQPLTRCLRALTSFAGPLPKPETQRGLRRKVHTGSILRGHDLVGMVIDANPGTVAGVS